LFDGDLLISITADIGIVGFVTPELEKPAYINQHIALVRFESDVCDSKFVSYFLVSEEAQRVFRAMTDAGAKAGMNLSTVKNIQVALPIATGEQTAIATALSDVDALIAGLAAVLAKQLAIKEGAMQELLSGKRRLPGFEGKWEEYSFGELFDYLPTATNPRSDLRDEADVYYLHYGDIHTRFHRHLDFRKHRLPQIDRNLCPNAALLQNGDWVMADASEDYDGVCKSVEILGLTEGMQAIGGLHTFVLREKRLTFALGYKGHMGTLKSLRAQFHEVMTGMKVFGVSKKALANLLLSVPSLDEQIAISEVLMHMDVEIAALETKLEKVRALKAGMMGELLTGRVRLI
jgi:type I restriction enzyme, S subunit